MTSGLKQVAANKTVRTIQLLGCSFVELKAYIESLLEPGMSWDNHGLGEGTWQIDHIVPIGLFDLHVAEQQMAAFGYHNLQPLWYADHIEKTKRDNAEIADKRRRLVLTAS